MPDTESVKEEVSSLRTILSNYGFQHNPREIRYDFTGLI